MLVRWLRMQLAVVRQLRVSGMTRGRMSRVSLSTRMTRGMRVCTAVVGGGVAGGGVTAAVSLSGTVSFSSTVSATVSDIMSSTVPVPAVMSAPFGETRRVSQQGQSDGGRQSERKEACHSQFPASGLR